VLCGRGLCGGAEQGRTAGAHSTDPAGEQGSPGHRIPPWGEGWEASLRAGPRPGRAGLWGAGERPCCTSLGRDSWPQGGAGAPGAPGWATESQQCPWSLASSLCLWPVALLLPPRPCAALRHGPTATSQGTQPVSLHAASPCCSHKYLIPRAMSAGRCSLCRAAAVPRRGKEQQAERGTGTHRGAKVPPPLKQGGASPAAPAWSWVLRCRLCGYVAARAWLFA